MKKLLVAVAAAFCLLPKPAAAQITRPIQADIPFPFTVADTQLPAGRYRIHVVDSSDLNIMQITSADRKTTVNFLVGTATLPKLPTKTELEFHKYGDHEFLAQIFQQGELDGVQVFRSRAESRLSKQKVSRTTHNLPVTLSDLDDD